MHTDTGDESLYSQWQPGLQLEEGNWLEDYNYWTSRRRQLRRCQANHPLSYEAFLRANQPAEGHPADDTWDYGQLYRLHMIRAQAAQDFKSFNITEDDVDNYLIRMALADNQLDNDATTPST